MIMTIPFPVAFWGSETVVALTKTWSDNIPVAESISYNKSLIRTWSDNISLHSELVVVSKFSVSSITLSETATIGESWSRTITTLTPTPPSGLNASRQANAGGVNLSWTDNSSNETAFVIERSLNGSTWTEVGTVGPNVTTDTDWATIPDTVPVISTIDSVGDDQITVSWGAVSQANLYKVYRSTAASYVPGDSNSVYVGQTSNTTYIVPGLTQQTTYRIIVRACNDFGDGAWSDISSQSTGPTVPISFSYPYSGGAYNLTWSNGTRDDTIIRIERSLNSGGSWSEINTVTAGSTSYSDVRSFAASTLYRIRYNGETSYAT